MILLAVVAVMMIFALVMPASAADVPCPGAEGGAHLEIYFEYQVCEPTCTQRGYTIVTCSACNNAEVMITDFTDATGHDFEISYEYDSASGTYTRVRECQNERSERCVRAGKDPETGLENEELKAYTETDTDYYLVEYINRWEPLDIKADAVRHKAAHLADYYVAKDNGTWVLDYEYADEIAPKDSAHYDTKLYTTGKTETVDNTVSAVENEYIKVDGELKLFVKNGTAIPEYEGENPVRFKDKTYGAYIFDGWAHRSTSNGVKTFEADFKGDASVTVSGVFYNYNGVMVSRGKTVPYGTAISYGDLVTPTRESDQRNEYTLRGWSFNRNAGETDKVYGIKEEIILYHNTGIYAVFASEANEYTLKFENFYGESFGVGDATVTCGSSFADAITGIGADAYNVSRDKEYLYERNEKAWVIKAVNGNALNTEVTVNPHSFDLPKSVMVKDLEAGINREELLNDGDVLTLTPKYDKYVVSYTFKVSIRPAYFRDEDVYEIYDELRSDILGDFFIQVTDHNGQYVASGKADENGDFWFTSPYRDALQITASMTNRKYYGEHVIDLKSCKTAADIERIEKNGIVILPSVTDEWLDGIKSCSCICHSVLSPLVVRIYNLLYRIFGYKYVCCDDLFIVHGSILAYTK